MRERLSRLVWILDSHSSFENPIFVYFVRFIVLMLVWKRLSGVVLTVDSDWGSENPFVDFFR